MQVFIAATDSYNLKNVRSNVKESIADVADVVKEGAASSASRSREPSRRRSVSLRGRRGTRTRRRGVSLDGRRRYRHDLLSETRPGWRPRVGLSTSSRRFGRRCRLFEFNMHFHDTRGTGSGQRSRRAGCGVDYFDASVGGMGGSPYAEGATGNVATEDLVHMLEDMDIDTGIDLDRLVDPPPVSLRRFVPGELPSKMLKAGPR